MTLTAPALTSPEQLSPAMRSALAQGFVTAEQAAHVDAQATQLHGPGNAQQLQVAVQLGVLGFHQAHEVYGNLNGWNYARLGDDFEPSPELIDALDPQLARELSVVPFRATDYQVVFATDNPSSPNLTERLKPYFPDRTVRLAYAPRDKVIEAVQRFYSAAREAQSVAGRSVEDVVDESSLSSNLGLVDSGEGDEAPRILRLLIEEALQRDASDIHFEQIEVGGGRRVQARFRIDGDLRNVGDWSVNTGETIVSLVEVRAELDAAQRLRPQSGSWTENINGKQVDMRVESSPAALGKEVTIRIQHSIMRPLGSLGMSDANLERYERAIRAPFGMILSTGPTGSGKSTTEYSTLLELRDESKKILTFENPVETRIGWGVSQASINDAQGFTFAEALRSGLRRDPDVMLVGEIRDNETAKVAIEAALTGHLLLSTLHTNDAPGAIARLRELGVAPSLLADALVAVVAQRLIKRLCDRCKTPLTVTAEEAAALGFAAPPGDATFYSAVEGADCAVCKGVGTRGRQPIHEVLTVTPKFRKLILNGASESDLVAQAREDGMTSLREDGWAKAARGIYDPRHVAAVVARDMN